ncbi:hypothetical protein [Sinorhizobium sp. BJ1]|uniref:hypothetical protein n=1 Tax=Sinorhizobium sp. BJ1 TaxID=2035455 RepID=UPI001FDEC66D|nr:hypothetical protein [Sinorhizobium sp. BJ1]
MLEAMRELAGSGLTLIIVSHEMAFARALAGSIQFVSDGNIIESGSELFDNPNSDALKQFMASIQGSICGFRRETRRHSDLSIPDEYSPEVGSSAISVQLSESC